MIVIAVIAILAAILIPNFLHARAESQTGACEGNEKQIATALEEYAADHNGAYPSSFGANGLTTPYLNFTYADPAGGGGYTITLGSSGSAFGSYEISDPGQHDSSTTTGLHLTGGNTLCIACTSVQYYQNAGVVGQ